MVYSLRSPPILLPLSLQVLAFVQALFSFTAQSNDLVRVSDEFRRRMTDESSAMADGYRQCATDMEEEFYSITTVELADTQVRPGLGFQLHTCDGSEDILPAP